MLNITIAKISDDQFAVKWDLHGWTGIQQCPTEDSARTYVAGFQDGFNAIKNVVGLGVQFDGKVAERGPVAPTSPPRSAEPIEIFGGTGWTSDHQAKARQEGWDLDRLDDGQIVVLAVGDVFSAAVQPNLSAERYVREVSRTSTNERGDLYALAVKLIDGFHREFYAGTGWTLADHNLAEEHCWELERLSDGQFVVIAKGPRFKRSASGNQRAFHHIRNVSVEAGYLANYVRTCERACRLIDGEHLSKAAIVARHEEQEK